jgi:phosphatidylinositol kinase/protein kinase (PI-3  family)
MEQVFDLVNVVLHCDRETKRRSLSVRGYKVIPLASQAGVLEFVGNTTPLASWLGNAHHRYMLKLVCHSLLTCDSDTDQMIVFQVRFLRH